MLLPQLALAQQRALVTSVAQVEADKSVRQYRDTYAALSAANLIYARCEKEYDLSDSDQAYLKRKFATVTQDYMAAYQGAYTTMTSAAPPQSFVDDVAKALMHRQQDAVDNAAMVLRQKKGCNDSRLRSFVRYVESLRKQDRILAETKPVVPAEPYQ